MTPRAVESRPSRATGLPADRPLDPRTLWSAETEHRAQAARRDARRARKQAERYRLKAARLAADIRNAQRREATLRAREAALLAELEAAGLEIARLAGVLAESDREHGAERLRAATEEITRLRPAGRHTRKDQTS